MSEVSQLESGQVSVPGTLNQGSAGKKPQAKRRDWLFLFLAALAAAVLIAALTGGLLLLLRRFVPEVDQQLKVVPGLGQQSIVTPKVDAHSLGVVVPSSTISWPGELQTGHILLVSLLFLAFALFMIARWRIVRNRSLWPIAGCPSCHEHELYRVKRSRKDRIPTWGGIPVGRYRCHSCYWVGRRINKGPRILIGSKGTLRAPAAHSSINPHGANSAPGAPQDARVMMVSSARDDFSMLRPANINDAAYFEDSTSNGPPPTIFAREDTLPVDSIAQGAASVPDREGIRPNSRGEIFAPLGLNLREDPHSGGVLLGTLEPGTIVLLLDNSKQEAGITWQQVQVGDQKGWVMNTFLRTSE